MQARNRRAKENRRERDSHARGSSKERVRAPLSVQASRKGASRRGRRGREEAAQAEEAEKTIIMPALLYKTMIQLHDALSCESIVRGTTRGIRTRKNNEPRQGQHANCGPLIKGTNAR